MSFVQNLVSGLTPPPYIPPVNYEGLEFRWRFLVFRPALYKNELYIVGGIVFYVLFAVFGNIVNSSKANKWFKAHLPLLSQQFSSPTAGALTRDGYSDYFNFSTGRRAVASLHTVFALQPRHDLLQWAFQTLRTLVDLQYRPSDDLQLDFKLQTGHLADTFVWGLAAKTELLSVKSGRWDLTFAKTTENPSVPPTLTVLSESGDVTDAVIKVANTYLTVLKDPKNLKYFRSISISDQPRERPTSVLTPTEREKHVILSLSCPPASDAAATIPLVAATFTFIDSLAKLSLRPETKNKLRKTREELDKELKEEAEREKKEELSQNKEDQRALKRKAQEERIAKLSAAEQQKILEKEKRRSMRKQQGKQVVRK